MEKTFSKVKVIWMTILSLVILFTGVLFVNMDKSYTQSQVSTVVSADTVGSTAPTLGLPSGATKWDDVFNLTIDGSTTVINGIKDEYKNITKLNVILEDNTTGDVLIKQKAFANLTNLTTVVISLKNPTLLENYLFDGCTNIEYIYFNANNVAVATYISGGNTYQMEPFHESINSHYGNNCHLIICEGVTSISDYVFHNADVYEVTISESVENFEGSGYDFSCNILNLNAINLDESSNISMFGGLDCNILNIGPNVTRIPNYMCEYSEVSQVNIHPNNGCLKEIGHDAFYRCSKLTSFPWLDVEDSLKEIDGGAFKYSGLTTLTIPSFVETMRGGAFGNLENLTSIYLNKDISFTPGMLEILSKSGSTNGCTLYIGEEVTKISEWLFASSNISSIVFEDGSQCELIKDCAFRGCTSLEEITLPNTLEVLGREVFGGTKISSITIPESVKQINIDTFINANNLTTINFNAKEILVNGNVNNAFVWQDYPVESQSITINIGKNVKNIQNYLFYKFRSKDSDSGVKYPLISSVNFETGSQCVAIGEYSFYNVIKSSTTISIPAGVNFINDYAFYDNNDNEDFILTIEGSDESGTRGFIPVISEHSLGVEKLYVPDEDYSKYDNSANYKITDNVKHLLRYSDQVESEEYKIILTNNVNSDSKEIKFYSDSPDVWSLLNDKNFAFDGYDFYKYYLLPDRIEMNQSMLEGVTENIEVVAEFTPIPYSINYNLGSGNWITGYTPVVEYYITSSTITLPTKDYIVAPNGYEFTGWTVGGIEISNIPAGSTGTYDLVAQYSFKTYIITYDDLYDGTHNNPKTYTINDSNITLTDASRNGYTFQGWYDKNNPSIKVETIDTSTCKNYELKAEWAVIVIPQYTLTLSNNINASTSTITFYEGDDVQLSTLDSNKFIINGYGFEKYYLVPDGVDPSEYVFDNDDIISSDLIGINRHINVIARFEASKYKINYDLGIFGEWAVGYAPVEEYYITSSVITLPIKDNIVVQKGYEFKCWKTTVGVEIDEIPTGSTGEYNLVAQYKLRDYKIEYDLVGGEWIVGYAPVEVYNIESSVITLPIKDNIVKTGYTFQGWYNKNNPSTKVETIDTSSCINYELEAKWSAITYKITLTNNIDSNSKEVEFNIGTTDLWLSLNSAKFVFNGYAFDGFYLGGKKLVEDDVEGLSKSITVLAQFNIEEYDITYDLGGGKWKDGFVPTKKYTVKTSDIYLPKDEDIIVPAGYEFVCWTNDVNTPIEKIPYGSTGLYYLVADYVAIEYEITYKYVDLISGEELNNQDIEDNNGTKFSVEHPIDFVSLKKLGYDFIGFTVDNVAVNSTSGMFEDIVVLGIFKIHDYEIKYANAENAKNDNPKTYTIKDDNIVLKPAIKEGYDFLGWFKQGTSTDELVTEIDTSQLVDYALYAKWEAQPGFPAEDEQSGDGNKKDYSGIGTAVLIGVIVSIVAFTTVCIVFMIRIKRKTDRGHPIVQGIPDSYKENNQGTGSGNNAGSQGYTSNLETRDGVQEIGKFLGGMSTNNGRDPYSTISSSPHVIPSDNAINANKLNNNENSNENAENVNSSQNNPNNNDNVKADQDNNDQ